MRDGSNMYRIEQAQTIIALALATLLLLSFLNM
jgi:hypothetical protein